MKPEMIRLLSWSLSAYQFFYLLGLLAGTLFILWLARRQKLDLVETSAFLLLGIVSGSLGARLLLPLLLQLVRLPGGDFSLENLGRDFASGGSFYGAVFATMLFACLYSPRYFGRKYPLLWDISVIGITLGHTLGRPGCFFAGCCYGKPTTLPWAVYYERLADMPHPLAGMPLHPVQLYEAVLGLANFIILLLLYRKPGFPGQIFSFYLVNYGLIRFFLEFLRHQQSAELIWAGGLSWHQAFSLLLIVAGGFSIRFFKTKYSAG